jgi:glycosyltransferase involved in cell wall biosynthesis
VSPTTRGDSPNGRGERRGSRPAILVTCGSYLPGFRGGGPVQSVSGLIAKLDCEYRFGVLTSDRDLGDAEPYQGVAANVWTSLGGAEVYYVGKGQLAAAAFFRALREFGPDIVYLNGYFSPRFSILPRLWMRLGRVSNLPVILAPRGEFSTGALALKPWKKRLFIAADKVFGLSSSILFQATGSLEELDIRRVIGNRARVLCARNLSVTPTKMGGEVACRSKHTPLNLLFLSRLSPQKGLDIALGFLAESPAPFDLTICGPIEDERYWRQCRELMERLPPGARVNYVGAVPRSDVAARLSQHDFLILPTRGENYGHVIAEALAAGMPVIVSDKTPWGDIEEARAGWAIPVNQPAAWSSVLGRCQAMNQADYAAMSQRARAYATQKVDPEAAAAEHRALFAAALDLRGGRRGSRIEN